MSRGFLVILAILALAFAVITGVAVNKGPWANLSKPPP